MRLILMPRFIERSRTFARVVGVALVGVAAASLSACSEYEPKPEPNPVASAPITIMIDPTSQEQRVLAEIYRQTLRDEGRAATVSQEPMLERQGGNHISGVSTNGNFFVGCTGEFLSVYNPEEARAISEDYVAAKEEGTKDVDFLERTHVALMASLPPEVSVVEPAGAEGCPNSQPELPQNYVVIYQDGLFNRDEKLEVASFTKFLTRQDLDDVVQEVEDSEGFEGAVRAWMEANLMQKLNEEGDSNSSRGSDLDHEES